MRFLFLIFLGIIDHFVAKGRVQRFRIVCTSSPGLIADSSDDPLALFFTGSGVRLIACAGWGSPLRLYPCDIIAKASVPHRTASSADACGVINKVTEKIFFA
jgi:hypothetical protein